MTNDQTVLTVVASASDEEDSRHLESIRLTPKHDLGNDFKDMGIADNSIGPESLWLTANDTTIYVVINIDVAQEPIVIATPPGLLVYVGLPGPDAGNGGKFLLLLPGYDGEAPSGYYDGPATMHCNNYLARGIIVDNDVPDAVARIRNVKVYPWSKREVPTPNKFVSISGAMIDTPTPGGMEYWARLAGVIDNNPVQEHDRFFMAMLEPLGIEKDGPMGARRTGRAGPSHPRAANGLPPRPAPSTPTEPPREPTSDAPDWSARSSVAPRRRSNVGDRTWR